MEMVDYALMIFVGGLLVWVILAAGVEQFSHPFGVQNLMRAILGGRASSSSPPSSAGR
jgi:hypothetical protein